MSLAVQKAAETLVDRARHGDQNAMAAICEVRKNKEHGNPKALLAFNYMLRYAQRKPAHARNHLINVHGPSTLSLEPLKRANVKGGNYGHCVVKFILGMGNTPNDCKLAAHGIAIIRPIDNRALKEILKHTPAELRGIFGEAYRVPSMKGTQGLDPTEMKCFQLGYILGVAKRVQQVRDGAPIKVLSRSIAWELGE